MFRRKSIFSVFMAASIAFCSFIAAAQETPPTAAPGQALMMPVYSIEAAEVNGVAIPNGPAAKITVAPGDVITAKIMLRNYSPQGEQLRGYQAKLDPAGFKSGSAGTLQPVGHNPGTNNDANAYIDMKDPMFVHKGPGSIPLGSVPLVDTASDGYRWLNVLLEPNESPVAKQDGKKFYCGTVKLTPSADASGIFTIKLMEEGGVSGLIDPANAPIVPVGFEPLQIEVKPGVKWLRIQSSDPPNGAVDGRIIPSTGGKQNSAWKTVMLEFNADVGDLKGGDFEVEDGTPTPPKIQQIEASGSQVLLTLDQPIRVGTWTTIKHKSSGTFTRIGRLPGDVNNDGKANTDDLMVMIQGLNAEKLPAYRGDLDADGKTSTRDTLQLIDLLTQKRSLSQSRMRK